MKGLFLFFLLIASCSYSRANFQSSFLTYLDQNSELRVTSPGRYPWYMRMFTETLFGWTPKGEVRLPNADCSYKSLTSGWMGESPAEQQAQDLSNYLKKCENEIALKYDNPIWNTYKTIGIFYDINRHPMVKMVVLNLPNQVRVKALLALKDEHTRRPFVIIRAGIFSSVEDFLAERFLLIHLFEEAPFNVLLVENSSGPDFIQNNSGYSFGGFEEGVQNLYIAKRLTSSDEPLNRIIESLHFSGISLGGNGILFSRALHSLNGIKVNSYLAMCPVVNLKETFDFHLHSSAHSDVEKLFINFWASERLQGLKFKSARISNGSRFDFLNNIFSDVQEKFNGALAYDPSWMKLPVGYEKKYSKLDFWQANDYKNGFLKLNSENQRSPLLVLATQNDPLVPPELNFKKLDSPKVLFAHGTHCSFPANYDWYFMSQIMRDYILSNSSGYKQTEIKLTTVQLPENFDEKLLNQYEVVISDGNSQVEFRFSNSLSVRVDVSKSQLKFELPLRTLAEKQMTTRYFSALTKLNIVSQKGKKWLQLVMTE